MISLYQVKLTGRIVLGMNTIQDKRARILASGTSVMLRKGYNGTGVQEITQGAGVPKGSFYHYFESKEDLPEPVLCEGKLHQVLLFSFSFCLPFMRWRETQID